jgi:hypothetical protein
MRTITKTSQTIEIEADRLEIIKKTQIDMIL